MIAALEHPIVLASGSPRRRELLDSVEIRYEVIVADVDEIQREDEAPEAMCLRLARDKACCVADRVGESPRRLVLGADTIVVLEGVVFGKPRDGAHALTLLQQLRGHVHEVITGVAVVDSGNGRVSDHTVHSRVTIRDVPDAELRRYIETGEPLDKAGAYAIQGLGGSLVSALDGSESNVIGLPLAETTALLAEAARHFGPRESR